MRYPRKSGRSVAREVFNRPGSSPFALEGEFDSGTFERVKRSLRVPESSGLVEVAILVDVDDKRADFPPEIPQQVLLEEACQARDQLRQRSGLFSKGPSKDRRG